MILLDAFASLIGVMLITGKMLETKKRTRFEAFAILIALPALAWLAVRPWMLHLGGTA